MEQAQVKRNRAQQQDLYGAPLGDYVKDAAETLGLTQARVAEVLGLSAPMLSQLVNAQRVKIGNPAVVQRLRDLSDLAEDVRGGLNVAEVEPRLAGIHDSVTTMSGPRSRANGEGTTGDPVLLIRSVLHAVASGRQLQLAAEQLQDQYADLAEVLRVYGTGKYDDAAAHFRSIRHLL